MLVMCISQDMQGYAAVTNTAAAAPPPAPPPHFNGLKQQRFIASLHHMSPAGQLELCILLPVGPKHNECSLPGTLLDGAEWAVLWTVVQRQVNALAGK